MDNRLEITYHNAAGKRNLMVINMDVFFPCPKKWINMLIKTVISRSEEKDEHLLRIKDYLERCLIAADSGDKKYRDLDVKRINSDLETIGGYIDGE